MRLRKNFRTKKIWPVSDLDPDPGFGPGFESGIRIRIRIRDSNPDSNPDPKPDPKLTSGRIRIRNRIRNFCFGSATLVWNVDPNSHSELKLHF
jgi:hypothetical protein